MIELPNYLEIKHPIKHLFISEYHAHCIFFESNEQIISIDICPQNHPSFSICKWDSLEEAKERIESMINEGWEV